MLSFEFTEEQEAYRVELARYARTRLLPAYRDRAAGGTSEIQKRISSKRVLQKAGQR